MDLPRTESIDPALTGKPKAGAGKQQHQHKQAVGLRSWAFGPDEQSGVLFGIARACVRVLLIMYDEYSRAHIALRASALTYAIILSMVPLLAMSTAVLKGLGSDNQLKTAAYRLINQLDPQHSDRNNSQKSDESVSPDGSHAVDRSLTDHLRNAVDTIFEYVDRTNFAALGIFGIIGLIVVVILVLSSVENAMNAIWHSRRGRSLFRKIMDYLALLILLPISINAALAGDTVLHSPRLMEVVGRIIPAPLLIKMILKFLPFLFIILTLMVMYLFFTTARVKTYAALCGAVFASIFWLIVQRGYIVLQLGVSKYNAIYGSFATVPLFLIWLHLGWTFILLGATMAYAIQNQDQYRYHKDPITPREQLQMAFDILLTAAENFSRRKVTTLDQLNHFGHNRETLLTMIGTLVQARLLARVCEQEDRVGIVPATPLTNVDPAEVVTLILGPGRPLSSAGSKIAKQIVTAAKTGLDRNHWLQVLEQSKADHGNTD